MGLFSVGIRWYCGGTEDNRSRMAAEWVMLVMKTSAMTTSIDEAGRILLPQLVRSQLGVKPGDELALQEMNGQWFLKPVTSAPALHDDDLNWKDLGYDPVPLPPSAQVTIRIEQRGKLLPMAHELDDE